MYNIISTGSHGNCVIYHKSIMVDIGVPYSVIKPYVKDIELVLLTHEHKDHINIKTLERLLFERPSVTVICGEFMLKNLQSIDQNRIMTIGIYGMINYYNLDIYPIQLYHDVPNFGWRIFKGDHKIIHATDTHTLQGITAKNYDLYMIEANYDADTVWHNIREQEANGQFAHQRGSINSHLSRQQAHEFFLQNKGEHSKLVALHQSKTS